MLWLALTALSSQEPPLNAPVEVTVELDNGRTFLGEVDAQSDDRRLWLRVTRPGVTLLRPIDWDRIIRVRQADDVLTAEQLRDLLPSLSTETPPIEPADSPLLTAEAEPRGRLLPEAALDPHPALPPRVAMLQIRASAANWDGDVEQDGIELEVEPLTSGRYRLPVEGTLYVHLLGSLRHREALPDLGRWTRRVRESDFVHGVAVYRLPFQAVDPQFDLEVEKLGLVHARLAVPAHGVFDASEELVYLRPFSAMREELQALTGRRFFPIERLGRTD
ncbi:MAG: hypothetical protein WDZ59_17615 [Pirellulales bacterium]